MPSPLSDEQKRERPYVVVGIVGSLLVLASFFFLPLFHPEIGGPHLALSGWDLWQEFSSPPPLGSGVGLILLTLLPACAFITLLIGCARLFRSLTRLWVHMFTLATLVGLGLLGLSFCTVAGRVQEGFFGMVAGYVCMLVGRSAFPRGPGVAPRI